MASEGEKTEEPTPYKLKKAREKGQVSKSADAVSALVFGGTFIVLSLSIGFLASKVTELIVDSYEAIGSKESELDHAISYLMHEGLFVWFLVSIPIASAAMLFGIIGNYAQIGFLFTTEPLKPELKKINPISGLKQLFSKKRAVELLKQVVKFSMVAYVVYRGMSAALYDVIMTQRSDLNTSISVALNLIKDIGISVASLYFVIGIADFFWQRYAFRKSMRMTKYEVKQEYKQSEGDPELKGERKRLAQELIMHGATENVGSADAVVTNPAHIACAIKYDDKDGDAPKLVAKGLRVHADKIKKIAKKHDVPILRNVPLAQALNKLDLDEEIPEELYEAVAEVLNFVYELKEEQEKVS